MQAKNPKPPLAVKPLIAIAHTHSYLKLFTGCAILKACAASTAVAVANADALLTAL